MFRYVAIAWNESSLAMSALADELRGRLQERPAWEAAIRRPGLHVFTRGAKPGVNGSYPLAAGRGVVLGKLFRRRDLGSATGLDVPLSASEAEQIVQTSGRALVRGFWGRYIAFLPAGSASSAVLRDPSGTLPCFRIRHRGVSIVFSWLEDALALLAGLHSPGVDWEALSAHLVLGELGGRATALEGVTQVLPGEAVDLLNDASTWLWSGVDFARSPAAYDADAAADLLRETVCACTRSWASCYDTLLLRLSGGLDSSILLSCLAPNATAADVLCVNYHSPGSDSDERGYARLAAARAGRDLIERERDPAFRIERILEMARMPTPVAYLGWMNAGVDARLAAAHRTQALFTGAGGDALFFEFPRWWPAADYLRRRGWDRGFASAALDAARLGRISVWRTMALASVDRLCPARLDEGFSKPTTLLGAGLATVTLRQDERWVHPTLLSITDLPIGKRMQVRALVPPIGYYDPFEQEAAAEVVHPLLSQPLAELCLRLPTYLLTQGGRGRALVRRAFARELPPQIATRRSKGGMEEHIGDVLRRNLAFARGMLLEGELVRRGLLDRAKVEEVLSGRPSALAGHLSQIHALIGVEAWIGRWSGPRSPRA